MVLSLAVIGMCQGHSVLGLGWQQPLPPADKVRVPLHTRVMCAVSSNGRARGALWQLFGNKEKEYMRVLCTALCFKNILYTPEYIYILYDQGFPQAEPTKKHMKFPLIVSFERQRNQGKVTIASLIG